MPEILPDIFELYIHQSMNAFGDNSVVRAVWLVELGIDFKVHCPFIRYSDENGTFLVLSKRAEGF